jgi:hypothetical protein
MIVFNLQYRSKVMINEFNKKTYLVDRVGFGPNIFGRYHYGSGCCHLTRGYRCFRYFLHFLFFLKTMILNWTSSRECLFGSGFIFLKSQVSQINKINYKATLLLLDSSTLNVNVSYFLTRIKGFFLVCCCCYLFTLLQIFWI